MPRLPRLELLEPRTLLSSVQFGLIDGRSIPARISPAAGVQVMATLKGPGIGTATIDAGGIDLLLEGTSAATTVTLKAGGRAALRLGDVDVRSPLGALKAPTADASGVFTFHGGVGAIDLRNASGLSVRAPGGEIGAMRVGATGSKRAARGAPVVFVGDVEATRLGAVSVGGSATVNVRVQFAGSILVAGNLSQSTITVIPAAEAQDASLGQLLVGGTMQDVKVVVMGDIGAVRATAMANTDVMAGVRYGALPDGTFEHVLPAETLTKDFDFTGQYRIGAVAVTGVKGENRPAPRARTRRIHVGARRHTIRVPVGPPLVAAPAPGPTWFGNSRIAAYDVGEVVLEGVSGSNSGRPHGVAAYRIGSVVRRFADPANTGGDFAVRQMLEPLVFKEGPSGYGGYFGAGYAGGFMSISVVDTIITRTGGTSTLPYVDIPATGAEIGSASVNGRSATLYLMPDGVYELRVGSEAPILRDANLAMLILSVAGTPGTSMKAVHRPAVGTSDGSVQFLSTSVSGSVTLTLPATPKPYRYAVTGPPTIFIGPHGMPVSVPGPTTETFYSVPTAGDLIAAIQTAGSEVRVFDRDFALVKPEGMVVGRAFDDTGLRKIVLTAQNTFRLTDSGGAVLWEGADLAAALMGTGPRLGLRRLPARLSGGSQLFLYGLGRGGTAVFDVAGRTTLDPAGNVTPLPDGAAIADRLRQAGLDLTVHGL